MATALALRDTTSVENRARPLTRAEVLARYRALREISKDHHSKILKLVSRDAILRQARRLGLTYGETLVLDDMDELNYVFDLAIHTATADRPRAIDRYARSARLAPGSDELVMLDAMREARFAVLAIERRHEIAGLIATDVFRQREVWLLDIGLESSFFEQSLIATRLFTPEVFSMTAGVLVPFEEDMLLDLAADLPARLGRMPIASLIDDRRFAEVIYRVALANGVMEHMTYLDLPDDIA
jgi:hypothetical protein